MTEPREWGKANRVGEYQSSRAYDIIVKRSPPTKWDKKGKFLGIVLSINGHESPVPISFLRVSEIPKLKAMIDKIRGL